MNTVPLRSAAALCVACLCAAGLAVAEVAGSEGWSRATAPGAREAVGYLVLTNKGTEERRLLKIVSPVSDDVRIFRSSISAEGVAMMWPVGFLRLEPGETVRFEPNGMHVMFKDIKTPWKAGDKVPLTLQFDGFEQPFTVMLEVRPLAPERLAADPAQRSR